MNTHKAPKEHSIDSLKAQLNELQALREETQQIEAQSPNSDSAGKAIDLEHQYLTRFTTSVIEFFLDYYGPNTESNKFELQELLGELDLS